MDAFSQARIKARAFHQKTGQGIQSAYDLVCQALSDEGYAVVAENIDGSTLKGDSAQLQPEFSTVVVRSDVEDSTKALLLAHELGHLVLHRPNEPCELEPEDQVSASRALSRVETYGPRERRELQANVFAREFLLPRDRARKLFLSDRLKASEIAERAGIPLPEVRRQLLDALLRYDSEPREEAAVQTIELDESQAAAVDFEGRALLLEAGPGSGKTRTLISRIERRLEDGVRPSEILALTFSNKAAAELSERIAVRRPEDAGEVWTGTFHAFGLEILRKYYDRLDLPPKIRLISPSQAVEMLEEHLPVMGLKHFGDLRGSADQLKEILKPISRAKDELIGPVHFRKLAVAGLDEAIRTRDDGTPANKKEADKANKNVERAEKTLEAATVYDVYEGLLRDHDCVDFADLVMRSAILMRDDEEVRATLQSQYREILVDEYQDVNRACAEMVKAVYGEQGRVWVIGDSRQSIYRFRGASSANMQKFESDYPGGTRMDLRCNYRSTEHVTSLCRKFASTMDRRHAEGIGAETVGRLPYEAVAKTEEPGSVTTLHVGHDDDCETELVADQIRELSESGVPFGKQTILARTNSRLDRLAEMLSEDGIPVLHLGSFFERGEVRDILSVLALVAEPNGGAIVRVAALRDLPVPASDIAIVARFARENRQTLVETLNSLPETSNLSTEGAANLGRIGRSLTGLKPWTPAFEVAAEWLLERSDYLRHLAERRDIGADLSRDAIRQLLEFLDQYQFDGRPLTATEALRRVRTVILMADDRDLREPGIAGQVDAVRLMTVHAAKGLEFEAVHVVGMHNNNFPLQHRSGQCLPPPGVEDGRDPLKAHEEEEDCAFFVAISRAERHLRLYHTEKAAKKPRTRSRFLDDLDIRTEIHLPAPSIARKTPEITSGPIRIENIDLRAIKDFDDCPLKLAYRYRFDLRSRRAESPFLKTSGVLYRLIDGIGQYIGDGADRRASLESALDEVWSEHGPRESSLESRYREIADRSVDALVDLSENFRGASEPTMSMPIGDGSVLVPTPMVSHDGRTARYVEMGAVDKKRTSSLGSGMRFQAAMKMQPFEKVEVVSLKNANAVEVVRAVGEIAEDSRKAASVLSVIRKGELAPDPELRKCVRCPHFFSCPATGAE